MEQRLSARAMELTQGGIRAFFDRAGQYRDAIHLGIGEPDFPTPPEIIAAAERALQAGFTHYSSRRKEPAAVRPSSPHGRRGRKTPGFLHPHQN